ncbi:hypothetical protein GWK47_028520 [Chionoecetes opilio]|uniref:Uncharacterized protein n=1 Tax=Chionoecetes opilio TaxID=41210 RepID=A0A8J4YM00_CHIOP|nr:hypothetical protein GWK47_028520 [Chionoecetes opilio]
MAVTPVVRHIWTCRSVFQHIHQPHRHRMTPSVDRPLVVPEGHATSVTPPGNSPSQCVPPAHLHLDLHLPHFRDPTPLRGSPRASFPCSSFPKPKAALAKTKFARHDLGGPAPPWPLHPDCPLQIQHMEGRVFRAIFGAPVVLKPRRQGLFTLQLIVGAFHCAFLQGIVPRTGRFLQPHLTVRCRPEMLRQLDHTGPGSSLHSLGSTKAPGWGFCSLCHGFPGFPAW